MSFSRAPRFSDNNSDVAGSPADFDLSLRLGTKWEDRNPTLVGSISEDGTMVLVVSSDSNRSSRSNLNLSRANLRFNNKTVKLRRMRDRRPSNEVPVGNEISLNQPHQENQDVENENNGELIDESENLPSTSGSVNRRKSNLPSTSGLVKRTKSKLPSTSGSVKRTESNLPSTSGLVNQRCSIDDNYDNLDDLKQSQNRSDRSQKSGSTPNLRSNKERVDIRKSRDSCSPSNEVSVGNEISLNQPDQENQEDVVNENNGELFDESENLPTTSGLVNARESNLTSTADSDNLSSLEQSQNRSSRSRITCSTPNKNMMDIGKSRDSCSNNEVSVGNEISLYQPDQETQEDVENENNGEFFDESQNLPSFSGSVNKSESNLPSTSSLEQSQIIFEASRLWLLMMGLNNQNELNQSICISKARETFIKKIDKIEARIKQLRRVLAQSNEKIQAIQIQNHHDKEKEKIYPNSEDNKLVRQKYDEIVKIISYAIKILNDEFECKRKASLRQIDSDMYRVMKNLHIRSKKNNEYVKNKCQSTASILVKHVMNVLNATNASEFEYESSAHESSELSEHESSKDESFEHRLSKHFSIMLREIEEMKNNTNENAATDSIYENTSKILSDELLNTKNELDLMKKEKLDLLTVISDILETLAKQNSVLDVLQNDVNDLRRDFIDKV